METLLNCNLCGSQKSLEFAPYREKWKLVCCAECNLVYLNPRPTLSEMDKFYQKDYECHWVLERYLNEGNKWSKRFYNGIVSAYSSERINFWKRFVFGLFRDHIGGLPRYRKNGHILDVGCADGFFLYLMKDLGWQVKGVEPSQSAATRAKEKGLDVFAGNLSEANLPSDYFDVVRFWHVIEHTHDPKQVLTEARRILKSDGELILGVPNIDSLTVKIFRDYIKWQKVWSLPLHLYFYSRKTLKNLLEKCGFKNISIGNHSGGSMRMVLEQLLCLSLLKHKWLGVPWKVLFLVGDFLVGKTPWADSLEARCKK